MSSTVGSASTAPMSMTGALESCPAAARNARKTRSALIEAATRDTIDGGVSGVEHRAAGEWQVGQRIAAVVGQRPEPRIDRVPRGADDVGSVVDQDQVGVDADQIERIGDAGKRARHVVGQAARAGAGDIARHDRIEHRDRIARGVVPHAAAAAAPVRILVGPVVDDRAGERQHETVGAGVMDTAAVAPGGVAADRVRLDDRRRHPD